MQPQNKKLRVRFFKKIQDWILKSERIRKWILRFFTRQINPRSFGSWCVKATEESSLEVDSSVPLTHHDPKDLGLICLVKKRKIYFRILSDFRIQSWIFLKKRTLRVSPLVFPLSIINGNLIRSLISTTFLQASIGDTVGRLVSFAE